VHSGVNDSNEISSSMAAAKFPGQRGQIGISYGTIKNSFPHNGMAPPAHPANKIMKFTSPKPRIKTTVINTTPLEFVLKRLAMEIAQ
jgi:hypothetical protein